MIIWLPCNYHIHVWLIWLLCGVMWLILCPLFSQYSHDYRCVFRYTPHSRGITGLVFPSSPSSPLLYTCSYDGTLRCANLEKGIFEEVRIYSRNEPIYKRSPQKLAPHYTSCLYCTCVFSIVVTSLAKCRKAGSCWESNLGLLAWAGSAPPLSVHGNRTTRQPPALMILLYPMDCVRADGCLVL